MRTIIRTWLPILVLMGVLALAAEGKKEATKDKPPPPPPTEEEIDKPTKPGVPPPQEIPEEPAKGQKDAEKEGDAPKPRERNPFAERKAVPKYAVPARITYSDGAVAEGYVWRPANGPARIFNRADRAHQDFRLSDLKRIDVKPETENFEQDWRWKEQGSSEMVKLDTGYFWNQYITTFTPIEGKTASGDCNGQFFLMTLDGKRETCILWKRQSGRELPHGKREELKPLVYVKSVEFTDDFLKKAEEKKE